MIIDGQPYGDRKLLEGSHEKLTERILKLTPSKHDSLHSNSKYSTSHDIPIRTDCSGSNPNPNETVVHSTPFGFYEESARTFLASGLLLGAELNIATKTCSPRTLAKRSGSVLVRPVLKFDWTALEGEHARATSAEAEALLSRKRGLRDTCDCAQKITSFDNCATMDKMLPCRPRSRRGTNAFHTSRLGR